MDSGVPGLDRRGIDDGKHGERRPRRHFLATSGAIATAAIAGCLGGSPEDEDDEAGGDDDDDTSGTGEPETPWETEELAAYVEDDTELTLYASVPTDEVWEDLIDIINDEYGTELELNVFASHGGEISQRIIQERQAGQDEVDVICMATDINHMIHEEGPEVAKEWYEHGIDEDYWFSDELDDFMTNPWHVSAFRGGPSVVLPINPEVFDEQGLDRPTSYNDLFDDQYEGLETVLPSFIVPTQMGWIIDHHASQTDMSNQEWIEELQEHLEFSGVDGHTPGARDVAEGRVALMFYNFPNTITQFMGDHPIEGIFVDGVWQQTIAGSLSINRDAPNPWAARFVLSASLEESVQKRILTDVHEELIPGRTDIEYPAESMTDFERQRLEAETTPVTFEEEKEYSQLGQTAVTEWIDL